jgi:Zn ribbon nucleic-acid-binding protein
MSANIFEAVCPKCSRRSMSNQWSGPEMEWAICPHCGQESTLTAIFDATDRADGPVIRPAIPGVRMSAANRAIARALIRAVMNIADQDSEAQDMSAAFDAGEFSARFHGPGSEHASGSIRKVLEQLNLTAAEADQLCMSWCQMEQKLIGTGGQSPLGYEVSCWIAAAFQDPYEHDPIHGRRANL